jgi:hypothetical protein
MLTAYFDESGHETKDATIVAGFLGDCEQWKTCAEQWRIGLGPKRKSLHMKDLRWGKDRTRRLLERLGPIPHECGLTAVVAVVSANDYDDLVSRTRAEKLTKGYYFCLITIFDALVKNTPKDQPIKLVFEVQNEYESRSDYYFEANKHHRTSTGEQKFSSIEHIAKDSSALTQPSDFLAFAILHHYRDPQSQKAKWCAPIMRNTRPAFGMVHDGVGLRDVIKSTLRKMPEFAERTEPSDK